MPKNETRFNADVWAQVWITQEELVEDPEIQIIRELTHLTKEEKLHHLLNRAFDIAHERITHAVSGLQIDIESLTIDSEFNHIDWEALL